MSAGILRIDTTNRGKSSGSASVNVEPTSPAPSVDRLSVTFAMDEPEKNEGDINYSQHMILHKKGNNLWSISVCTKRRTT